MEKKKSRYTPAHNRAAQKYVKNNYDTILLKLRKDGIPTKEDITRAADLAGESVNNYIKNSVADRIQRDGGPAV